MCSDKLICFLPKTKEWLLLSCNLSVMYIRRVFHVHLFTVRIHVRQVENKDLRFIGVHFMFLHCLLSYDSSSSHQYWHRALSLGHQVSWARFCAGSSRGWLIETNTNENHPSAALPCRLLVRIVARISPSQRIVCWVNSNSLSGLRDRVIITRYLIIIIIKIVTFFI